uniref:Uncharacterized protein n=1 Tax=Oryza punctata TaxID=4537 RepID=A0A0E0M388_ORYPU
MKIGKAPELLKKAATIVRSKASTVRARLLIVASLRRRMAMIGAISHRIHALMVEKEKERVDYYNKNKNHHGGKALVMRKAKGGCEKPVVVVHDEMVITDHDRHLSELAMSDQEDHHGYANHWTHSLFNDDDDACYNDDDQDDCGDDDDVHGVLFGAFDDGDEPSVIDIIRSNREDEGLEFNIDDEIDQAADMFIRRFRNRMNRSMKIGKAPELLKKAATIVRSKASTVRARLLIVASLRRRMAMIGAISHRIHALMVEKEKARVDYYHNKNHDGKALALRKVVVHDEMVITDHDHHLRELAMFDQEDHHGYTDHWTHSLFNDDDTCYSDDQDECGDDDDVHGVLFGAFDDVDDEPSVIDIIRSNREDEGLEFNIDDEIDQAADMFIRRIRNRMNRSI